MERKLRRLLGGGSREKESLPDDADAAMRELRERSRQAHIESPPAAADGLSYDVVETSLFETGDEFAKAFRLVMQCHHIVNEIGQLWKEADFTPPGDYHPWQIELAVKTVREAEEIARQCWPGDIIRDFEALFGVSYDSFWADIENLKDKFGGR